MAALDLYINLKYQFIIIIKIIAMLIKVGPVRAIKYFRRYPWLFVLLKVNKLLSRLIKNRYGIYRHANAIVITGLAAGMIEVLKGIFFGEDKLILIEDVVPPEIFRAMGLNTWVPELLGLLLPMIDPGAAEEYIDRSENEGIPGDICSIPKSAIGLSLKGHLPSALAIISTNMPCDGGMISYSAIQKEIQAPIYKLDIPYDFYNEKSVAYFIEDIKKMINWLEEHTPGRMDWDLLRKICTERNKMLELELELWEMIRMRPAPMAAEPVYLGHIWNFMVSPGDRNSTKIFEDLVKLTRLSIKKKTPAVSNERYRALLWNPLIFHFIDLFSWAEQAYGVTMIMENLSYNNHPFINTDTPESMLHDLAAIIMQAPMARHTRGKAENYFNDMFRVYKQFDIDMIWVGGHIGCKNTLALFGMLREKCREKNIPLLVIENDLADPRIVSRDDIVKQIEYFMENVMKAKRLDK